MKKRILGYVSTWESRGYPGGIPDEAPPALEAECRVPSYRAICRAIMKNDVALVSLGFSREPCETYNALKRIELRARGVIPRSEGRQSILAFGENR